MPSHDGQVLRAAQHGEEFEEGIKERLKVGAAAKVATCAVELRAREEGVETHNNQLLSKHAARQPSQPKPLQ